VYSKVRLDEVFEARMAIEETVAELASRRVTETDIIQLRDLAAAELAGDARDLRVLHAQLGAMSGNPALEVFVDILNQASNLYLAGPSEVRGAVRNESAAAHAAIVRAVVAGKPDLARHRMRRHLRAEAEFLRRRRSSHQLLGARLRGTITPVGAKRAEATARDILADVVAKGWPVGAQMGSEAELMERHGVSRAVLREAVRLLEHHRIAAMRRGPGGGLFVTEPGVDAITDAVANYQERKGIEAGQLAEMRVGVELAAIELVVDRLDEDGVARLEDALIAHQPSDIVKLQRS
jgi:DNA-binding FadR family transcriptional regulator